MKLKSILAANDIHFGNRKRGRNCSLLLPEYRQLCWRGNRLFYENIYDSNSPFLGIESYQDVSFEYAAAKDRDDGAYRGHCNCHINYRGRIRSDNGLPYVAPNHVDISWLLIG